MAKRVPSSTAEAKKMAQAKKNEANAEGAGDPAPPEPLVDYVRLYRNDYTEHHDVTMRLMKDANEVDLPFISGALHQMASALIRKRDAELDQRNNLRVWNQMAEFKGTPEEEAAYFLAHREEIFTEIFAPVTMVQSGAGKESPDAGDASRKFIHSIARIALCTDALDAEWKELIASEPDSPFWLEQNLVDLRRWVAWFRNRLGL